MKIFEKFLADNHLRLHDIPFEEITLNDKEKRVFLDPMLLMASSMSRNTNSFIKEASDNLIAFNSLLCAYLKDSNSVEEFKTKCGDLLLLGKEADEYHIGYGQGRVSGRGTNEDMLAQIFTNIKNLVDDNDVNNDFFTFLMVNVCENFADDRMSDLLGNIIKEPMLRYTTDWLSKNALDHDLKEKEMFYWDSKENTFATKKMQVPVIEDKFVIFTPRCLVRGKLVEDAPRILRVFIVGVLQELDYEQHKNETDYKKKSKKQIKKEIKKNTQT